MFMQKVHPQGDIIVALLLFPQGDIIVCSALTTSPESQTGQHDRPLQFRGNRSLLV